MLHNQFISLALVTALSASISMFTTAAVSPEAAAQLGDNLTPLGGEMAGNAAGTIPAWTGGLNGVPETGGIAEGGYPKNPYSSDAVLFSITTENMSQYAEQLSEGQKALLKRYPDTYRLDIYPTHRSAAAPDWVYENTKKNAVNATQTDDTYGTLNAYGGIPFPIPENASQVVANHLLKYNGSQVESYGQGAGIKYPGKAFMPAGTANYRSIIPYYDKDGSVETFDSSLVEARMYVYEGPARRKGEILLINAPLDASREDIKAWMYLPGQRRVRRSPSVGYDNPNPATGGLNFYDESTLYSGVGDRFDWELVGKKEIYIPYNNYEMVDRMADEVAADYHLNPDMIRWELHRVWVVEATVKLDQRHAYSSRRLYFDEDSWSAMLSDNYDSRGNLWRTGVATSYNYYQLPGFVTRIKAYYDLQKDEYGIDGIRVVDKGAIFKLSEERTFSVEEFSPEEVRRIGKR